MASKRSEPPQLKRGREHDREEKESWRRDGMDLEFAEKPGLEKYSTGRRGFTDIRGPTMQAAIQFQRRPVTPGRAELVERTFTDHGISCVWLDS